MPKFERKEGDKGYAFHPDLNKLVEIVYQRRRAYLKSEDVEVFTLLGVHLDTDTVLLIPAQSEQDVSAAVRAKREALPLAQTLQV